VTVFLNAKSLLKVGGEGILRKLFFDFEEFLSELGILTEDRSGRCLRSVFPFFEESLCLKVNFRRITALLALERHF